MSKSKVADVGKPLQLLELVELRGSTDEDGQDESEVDVELGGEDRLPERVECQPLVACGTKFESNSKLADSRHHSNP
jgi:hypothetical protein